MVYPIVVFGSPILRKVAKNISEDYKDLDILIADMYETMEASDGVGLAAPQIGKSIRVFVIDASPMAEDDPSLEGFKKVFINPKIVNEEGDKWGFVEGCLSLPDIREEVIRHSRITIEYQDEKFEFHKETYDGIKARVIQHEYDHLDGVLFSDLVSPLKKKLLKGRLSNIAKGKAKAAYRTRVVK
jgi:peptide deformylase